MRLVIAKDLGDGAEKTTLQNFIVTNGMKVKVVEMFWHKNLEGNGTKRL